MIDPAALQIAMRVAKAESRVTRYIPHRPHPKQQLFLDQDDCLEVGYGGSVGGGKSDALLHAALQYVHVPDYAAMLFRRTYTDLALEDAIMNRSQEWLGGTDAHWADREKRWTFPSGATLSFGYMDGPRDHMRYKSAAFHFIGFDEVTEFEERQYRYMFSRLRRKRAGEAAGVPLRMRSATNPGDIGHDWYKKRFGIPDELDFGKVYQFEGRRFVPSRLEDNPSLDRAEYEKALSELDPATREQLRFGRWVRDAGSLVYKANRARNLVPKLPDLPPEEDWSHVLGLDFGVVDDTAFAVLAFAEHHPVVYCIEAGAWTGLGPSAAAEQIRMLEERYLPDRIVGDVGGLGKGYQAEAQQRFTLPVEAAQKHNKLGYIRLINGDMHEGKLLFVAGTAEETLAEMEKLAWADERQLKEHPSLPNHRSDALLYAWREAKHWAWEARDESEGERVRREARRNYGHGEAEELERFEREDRRSTRTSRLLGLR